MNAVFLVFDNKFSKFFLKTYLRLRTVGNFKDHIVVISNEHLKSVIIKIIKLFDKKVSVYNFTEFEFDSHIVNELSKLKDTRFTTKKFQFHKLNIFRPELKKFSKIFYMDINMRINSDINPFFELIKENQLIASYDGDEDFKRSLKSQFDNTHNDFSELQSNYNLEISDYFQSGLLLFDSSIIEIDTIENIFNLIKKYPISITNEQAYLNLYFLYQNPIFVPLQSFKNQYFYTFWHHKKNKYIITKREIDYRYYLQRDMSPDK